MRYRFHDYELDDQNYQLRRLGMVVKLEPKVFAVLAYLLRHRDRVVTRDELQKVLWAGQVVGPDAVTRCITAARKAVGDDSIQQHVIKTQHSLGYHFIAPVTELVDDGKAAASLKNPTLAVLPFTNMSDDPAQTYFTDGFAEDLITDLAKLSGLFVIARHSSFIYKDKSISIAQIGRELGAHYVVEGSVRKAGAQVRVTAQLVDAITEHHVWAGRYDRELREIFTLQDDLRRKIVTALKVKLLPEEQVRFQRAATSNLEAYDYYLRGVDAYRRLNQEANLDAQHMFTHALELDPCYAAAYAFLGLTYMAQWVLLWEQNPQLLDQALATVQQALGFDDALAGAFAVLSWVYVWKKQHTEALSAAERAMALDPNHADSCSFVAQTLNLTGRPHEALRLAQHAIRLNPHAPAQYPYTLGWSYLLTGRYDAALVAFKKSVAMRPTWWPPHLFLVVLYSDLGRWQEARAEAAEILRIAPNFSLQLVEQRMPYKEPATLRHTLAALSKAGIQ